MDERKRQHTPFANTDSRRREKVVREIWAFKKWVEYIMGLKRLVTGLDSEMPLRAWKAEEMTRQLVIHRQQERETISTVPRFQE